MPTYLGDNNPKSIFQIFKRQIIYLIINYLKLSSTSTYVHKKEEAFCLSSECFLDFRLLLFS